jgi:hypothetical protein
MRIKNEYSTNRISSTLITEIKNALRSVKDFGSVEIYIQNGVVEQITTRQIKKTTKNGNGNGFKNGI